ncbi:Protein KRI1 [Candida viswanathii]|uniref:Protein KRI1 n=1 Tax=Candida viswanathii TaxID=5486 RepID=A0A367YFK4_9ASCO|nr:Protein KRI1 [Candida viswanathii]
MARKKSAAKKAREEAAKQAKEAGEQPAPIEELKEEIPKAEKVKPAKEIEVEEEDESSSSEEDEYGDLITEDVETGINEVLTAIKTNPSKLLDPNVKFFEDPENVEYRSRKEKHKPLYLSDYNRMQLLDGGYKEFDESETVDGQKSFVAAQQEEKDQLLAEIKNAFNEEMEQNQDEYDDDGDDDGFLKKKERKEKKDEEEVVVPGSNLPDPSKDQQGFLSAFLDQQAWIPKKGDKVINLDRIDQDDEEDFDNAVEDFEHAYNFRYEDPNSAEIVSYARNQATLRRSKTNSRKRQREKKQELKRQEDEIVQDMLKKKKTSKVNKVLDRLTKIKEAVGDEVSDETIERVFGDALLQEDFDDADWDNKMAEIFNEQYYGAELEKPTWDDEIMDDFKEGGEDVDDLEERGDADIEELPQGEDNHEEGPSRKKSKKEILKEKKSAKKEKEALKEKAQAIVEANSLKIMDEVEEERGRQRDKDGEVKFKYREVSPEAFGLTTRDILLADDKQLNNFIGIKKFAPYRPKELRMKDKRKYTKKKHLQEWKKETFKNIHIPEEAKEGEIWIPDESQPKESKKDKKKDKKRKSRA